MRYAERDLVATIERLSGDRVAAMTQPQRDQRVAVRSGFAAARAVEWIDGITTA